MLVLFETAAGYAIFKLLEEQKLEEVDSLYSAFQTVESANQIIKLKHFEKFADIAEALSATTAAIEGKISKSLKKLIKKHVVDEHEKLLVADSKLGVAIRDKFSLQCLANTSVQHLMRCIRSQLNNLISGISQKEMSAMALGLAHSLSRYKLKFSPDKVDTMIVQAVSLLDDLDKELNNYTMRCREWYGWHFPELSKIVTDNIAFVKTVKIIGTREHAVASDLSDILSEELEEKVKEAAEISMGTEIADDDIMNIVNLCDQIVDMTNYRHQLYDYLKNRMMALAPNLTILVGDLVGARLVAHAGSLINLAKQPASTVQILGAEKALFRALKTRKDTPKYGLIYHSQLIGQCSTKNKGKMSRMLAAKAALATRVDALGDDVDINMGAEHKAKLEARLKLLEQGNMRRISGTGKAKAKFEKYHGVAEVKQYPDAADSTLPSTSGVSTSKRKRDSEGKIKDEVKEEVESEPVEDEETKPKKKKKKVKEELAEIKDEPQQMKKKKAKEEVAEIKEEPQEKKKKKKKKQMDG